MFPNNPKIPNQRVQTLRKPVLCVKKAMQFVSVEQSAEVKSKANPKHASWNGGARPLGVPPLRIRKTNRTRPFVFVKNIVADLLLKGEPLEVLKGGRDGRDFYFLRIAKGWMDGGHFAFYSKPNLSIYFWWTRWLKLSVV